LKAPKYLELADASLVAIRATAAAINGRHCDPFERSKFDQVAGRFLNKLPKSYRKRILYFLAGTMGVAKEYASSVSEEDILRWALNLYGEEGSYDGVVVGAPNGAVSHLGALLRFPFLTQHYLLAFKGKFAPDDSRAQFEAGVEASREIVASNPHLEAIIHYDPLHDRFLITRVNFIRIKLKRLPQSYKDFIRKRVKPGGTVVSIDCSYPCLQYPVKSDSGSIYYQVGGLGDITPGEYLSDSERLKEYRGREGGDPDSPWGIPDIEPVEMPESEWGSVGNLADDLKEFCNTNGYRLIEISYPHPEDYSLLAFEAYKESIRLMGEPVVSTFFDCFTHIDPRFNLITHTPSVWLPFICRDSLRFAGRVAKGLPKEYDIYHSLHPSFCDPVDLTPLGEWRELFSKFKSYTLLGVDSGRYPADLTTYVDFSRHARRTADQKKHQYALAIDADMLSRILQKNRDSG